MNDNNYLLGDKDEEIGLLPKEYKKGHVKPGGEIVKDSRRYFTKQEQRMLIDEDGVAVNADGLEIEGTHYENSSSQDIYFSMPKGL